MVIFWWENLLKFNFGEFHLNLVNSDLNVQVGVWFNFSFHLPTLFTRPIWRAFLQCVFVLIEPTTVDSVVISAIIDDALFQI